VLILVKILVIIFVMIHVKILVKILVIIFVMILVKILVKILAMILVEKLLLIITITVQWVDTIPLRISFLATNHLTTIYIILMFLLELKHIL
jgi:hypothetical protein